MKPSPTDKHLRARQFADLQKRLGYEFQNTDLLDQALTHRSSGSANNERLEFLGDAVLGYVMAASLYDSQDLQEGRMTLARSRLVKRSTLAAVARDLDLGAVLYLGVGEKKSGGHDRDSILADALEAVIGAIHEDGGIDACRATILKLYHHRTPEVLAQADKFGLKDPKTRLQEYLQARKLELPAYTVVHSEGDEHERTYTVRCSVEELDMHVDASATNRRTAEKLAAAEILDRLEHRS
jgi:ribonuclease-3